MANYTVEKSRLAPGSAEYQEVVALFQEKSMTSSHLLDVVSIDSVSNRGLELKFKEQEEEYKRAYGHVRTVSLWHGTKYANLASILRDNLDVGKHGNSVGHRFGAGVSFSAHASYASHYTDKGANGSLLLCRVLVSNIAQVEENKSRGAVLDAPPLIPGRYPLRFDTTAKNKETMDVIVKFHPHSFLPTHLVRFRRLPLPDPLRDEDDDEDTDGYDSFLEDSDDYDCGDDYYFDDDFA